MCSAVEISGIRAGEDVNLVDEIRQPPASESIILWSWRPTTRSCAGRGNTFRGFIFSFTSFTPPNTGLFTLGFPRVRAGLPKST